MKRDFEIDFRWKIAKSKGEAQNNDKFDGNATKNRFGMARTA